MAAPDKLILVVEDQQDLRELMEDVLQENGYSIAGASRASDALKLIQNGLRPAAVLADLVMPGMPGADFVRAMRQTVGDAVPVIITTGSSEDISALDPAAVLRKPFDLDELVEALDQVCQPTRR